MSQEHNHSEELEQETMDSTENSEIENMEDLNEESCKDESIEEDPISILEREKQELKNAYLRLSAETDNYRKRIQQEKESFKKMALKGFMENLLPVIDNLERSLEATKTSDNIETLREGVGMILTQFETVLKDVGLEIIEVAKGDEFNPQYCEAVMMEESSEVEHSMTVTDIFETGRKIDGHVLRTAKVKVAKKI